MLGARLGQAQVVTCTPDPPESTRDSQSLFLGSIHWLGWLTSQGNINYSHLFIIKDITVDKNEDLERMYVQATYGGGVGLPLEWLIRPTS